MVTFLGEFIYFLFAFFIIYDNICKIIIKSKDNNQIERS